MAPFMLFLMYFTFLVNADSCRANSEGNDSFDRYNNNCGGYEKNRRNCQDASCSYQYDSCSCRNNSNCGGGEDVPLCGPDNDCNIYRSCTPCGPFPSKCKPINTINTTLSIQVLSGPFYGLYDNRPGSENIDNACYSYLKLGGCRYVQLTSIVYKNGSKEVKISFASDYGNGFPGIFRLVGPKFADKAYTSEMDTDFLYAVACANSPSAMYMVYQCQLYGECPPDYDYRFTLSRSTNISEECLNKAMDALNSPAFVGNSFNRYPCNLPSDCKSSFLGNPVYGAGDLPPSDYPSNL